MVTIVGVKASLSSFLGFLPFLWRKHYIVCCSLSIQPLILFLKLSPFSARTFLDSSIELDHCSRVESVACLKYWAWALYCFWGLLFEHYIALEDLKKEKVLDMFFDMTWTSKLVRIYIYISDLKMNRESSMKQHGGPNLIGKLEWPFICISPRKCISQYSCVWEPTKCGRRCQTHMRRKSH